MKELQGWIETPLFQPKDRAKAFVLSPEGEALGRSILSSMRDIDAAVASIREAKRANCVTISTTPSFAVRWLLPRLPSFEAEHPHIEVSVVVDQQPREPSEDGADIAIRMGQGPWPHSLCKPLMNDSLYPVMSHDYWQKSGRPENLSDLSRLRLLHDRDPNSSWGSWKNRHGPPDLDIRTGSRFTSSDLVLRAAEQGLGVALARDRMAQDSLKTGTLVRPFGALTLELEHAYWIILDNGSAPRLAVQSSIDWLNSQTGEWV